MTTTDNLIAQVLDWQAIAVRFAAAHAGTMEGRQYLSESKRYGLIADGLRALAAQPSLEVAADSSLAVWVIRAAQAWAEGPFAAPLPGACINLHDAVNAYNNAARTAPAPTAQDAGSRIGWVFRSDMALLESGHKVFLYPTSSEPAASSKAVHLYTSPTPSPASAPAVEAEKPVASIYITSGGAREFDDWRHPLPVGRNLLYTRPASPAPAQGAGGAETAACPHCDGVGSAIAPDDQDDSCDHCDGTGRIGSGTEPTEPGWYVVLPPDFDEPTVRALGRDGQWWIPLGKGNGDDGWMTGRQYAKWVGPIASIDEPQPFLSTQAQPDTDAINGATQDGQQAAEVRCSGPSPVSPRQDAVVTAAESLLKAREFCDVREGNDWRHVGGCIHRVLQDLRSALSATPPAAQGEQDGKGAA